MTEPKTRKPGWRRVKFGDVVRFSKVRSKDLLSDGIERYVVLEQLELGDLRIRSWDNSMADLPPSEVNHPGFELTPKSWTVNSQEQAACNRYSTELLPPSFNLMRFLL